MVRRLVALLLVCSAGVLSAAALLQITATTTAAAGTYNYDAQVTSRVGVGAMGTVGAGPAPSDGPWRVSARPSVEGRGTSTTSHRSVVATMTAYRGPSQLAPGGQAGPAVSIDQVRQCLGRCGLSVRDYNIVHTPVIQGITGPAYGQTAVVNGRATIHISNMGLSSMDEAVTTIFHEVYHVNSFRAFGHGGTEAAAETYGQRMLGVFQRLIR